MQPEHGSLIIMAIVLEARSQAWECPNCNLTDVTVNQPNRFHNCRGMAGLYAPMVPAGQRCRVRAVEREDYEGREDVQRDGNGRPVMSVITERPDGSNDVAVMAPTAHMSVED